jgi:hypothetical protein
MTMRKVWLLGLTGFAALQAGTALAAEFVVGSASPGTYAEGTIIDGGATVSIPPGASVTLIGDTGAVLKLDGPYNGKLPKQQDSGGSGGVVRAIARLIDTSPPEANALLTMRSVAAASPSLWTVDLNQPGTYCVPPSVQPTLTREDDSGPLGVVLQEAATGTVSTLDFAAWVKSARWPSTVPLSSGGMYRVEASGDRAPHEFRLFIIPADLPTEAHRIAWMADQGCTKQARQLLAKIK